VKIADNSALNFLTLQPLYSDIPVFPWSRRCDFTFSA